MKFAFSVTFSAQSCRDPCPYKHTCAMAKNQGPRSSRSRVKYTFQDPGFPRSRVKYTFQDPGFPRSREEYAFQDPGFLRSHVKSESEPNRSPESESESESESDRRYHGSATLSYAYTGTPDFSLTAKC